MLKDLIKDLIKAINNDEIKRAKNIINGLKYVGVDIVTIYALIKNKTKLNGAQLYILLTR